MSYHNCDRKLKVDWRLVKFNFGHVEFEVSVLESSGHLDKIYRFGGRGRRRKKERGVWICRELGKEFTVEPQGL